MKQELLLKKLGTYGLFATAFLAHKNSDAQVVYTDVDPDLVLNSNEFDDLDLNNDGTNDFGLANIQSSFNAAIGISVTNSAAVAGYMLDFYGTSFAMASMLDEGDPIGPTLNWNTQTSSGNAFWGSVFGFGDVGPWDNVTNKFAGLRIIVDGNTHYGWARFDVSHTKLTLKDYAYDETPDAAINGELLDINGNPEFFPTVYSYENHLQIILPTSVPSAEATIFDMNGRMISNKTIFSNENIEMGNLSKGMYLVRIANGEKMFSTIFTLN